jgi:nitric oxide reductase subunit B
MQLGSIWGHGGYVAPDWGTDWLHREATTMLDIWARRAGAKEFASLDPEAQAALKERLRRDLRTNSYESATDTITVSQVRAEAMADVGDHYVSLFSSDPALRDLRVKYAIPERSIMDRGSANSSPPSFFGALGRV